MEHFNNQDICAIRYLINFCLLLLQSHWCFSLIVIHLFDIAYPRCFDYSNAPLDHTSNAEIFDTCIVLNSLKCHQIRYNTGYSTEQTSIHCKGFTQNGTIALKALITFRQHLFFSCDGALKVICDNVSSRTEVLEQPQHKRNIPSNPLLHQIWTAFSSRRKCHAISIRNNVTPSTPRTRDCFTSRGTKSPDEYVPELLRWRAIKPVPF